MKYRGKEKDQILSHHNFWAVLADERNLCMMLHYTICLEVFFQRTKKVCASTKVTLPLASSMHMGILRNFANPYATSVVKSGHTHQNMTERKHPPHEKT